MRVPDDILQCVCFLCTEKAGKVTFRGTAFFVTYKDNPTDLDADCYLVTAKHVVERSFRAAGHIKARINTNSGFEFIDLPAEWKESELSDLAVLPFSSSGLSVQTRFLPTTTLATDAILNEYDIGIGDEVLISGLFALRHGTRRNLPIVRAGIVAAMPAEPLEDKNTGQLYDAYLVEARSLGGLSGSPVFCFVSESADGNRPARTFHYSYDRLILLGVVRSHWDEPVESKMSQQELPVNMGIAVITPAQKLSLLLEHEDLRKKRKAIRQAILERNAPTLD